MPRNVPAFALCNPSGIRPMRYLAGLAQKAAKPSVRAFVWVATAAPIGSPLRPSGALLDVLFFSDQSGLEVICGRRKYGFGIEPR